MAISLSLIYDFNDNDITTLEKLVYLLKIMT